MTPETELLPCPLCAGTVSHRTDKGFHYGDHGYREKIEEFRCQCGFYFSRIGDDITKEQAIEKYNTRPAPKAIDVEALGKEIDLFLLKKRVLCSSADAHELAKHLNNRGLFGQVDQAAVLKSDQVEWIVNDNGELGVKINNQCFFLYKGRSLIYGNGEHDNGSQMYYRPVFKREFGECAFPINYKDPTRIGTVSLDDSEEWTPLHRQQEKTHD